MLIFEDALSIFTHRSSLIAGLCSIFVSIFTITMLTLCSKKAPQGQKNQNSIKGNGNGCGAAPPVDAATTLAHNRSQKLTNMSHAAAAGATPIPDTPAPCGGGCGAAAAATPVTTAGVVATSKTGKEKSMDDQKPQTKADETKEKEDSFENHKPVAKEAKRADEIKKHGPVDQKRKDYKTLRYDIPSSDFDKSLGIPTLEAKEKQDAANKEKQQESTKEKQQEATKEKKETTK